MLRLPPLYKLRRFVPPLCGSSVLVRATIGVVSAIFGTMSYFAISIRPLVRTTLGGVSVKFWDFGVALAKGGVQDLVEERRRARASVMLLC
jgi:hypothetical protein